MRKSPEAYFFSQKKNKIFYFHQPLWAYAYYSQKKICLLTGEESAFDSSKILDHFNFSVFKKRKNPRVDILYYELAQISRRTGPNELLLISIDFSQVLELNFSPNRQQVKLSGTQRPVFKNYEKKFNLIYQHLLAGDCYQVNLTEKFKYQYVEDNIDWAKYFFSQQFQGKLGAYAHVITLPFLNKVIMSNSPECLFQVHQRKAMITSMPIKGTISDINDPQDLLDSSKNESELFMIADLIRNDLAKLKPYEARILKKKKILKVPGLFHQYSLVSNKLREDLLLKDIVNSLFPGGSITGAPKKRVCEIIKKVEIEKRDEYCGTTILHWQNSLTGSINIRTATINTREQSLEYGAGGGITLNSQCREEFEELTQKNKSFIDTFFYNLS